MKYKITVYFGEMSFLKKVIAIRNFTTRILFGKGGGWGGNAKLTTIEKIKQSKEGKKCKSKK